MFYERCDTIQFSMGIRYACGGTASKTNVEILHGFYSLVFRILRILYE